MKATYKIKKLLGEGSFGKAYLAEVEGDEKKYVIKQVMMDGLTEQEKKETFNEAAILKRLDHPNIIKFKEVFIQRKPKEALNIVTEFADGGDLGQKIESQNKQPFKESQILDYITQICLALQHLHKKKIIHRDLKSGNVFLMQSGIVKLGDFGISKGLRNSQEKAKTMVGTPYYLAPEIINGQQYDAKCDIWALGILLYELMTFKMPFNAVSLPLLSIKINRGVYKPPPSTYSNEIKDLLKKCLTIEPDKRPSIDEILKLPLIKDRIKSFLNEVQYDQDLSKTMTKQYKHKKKEERHKEKHKKESEQKQTQENTTDNSNTKTAKPNNEEKKEKNVTNDKNKVSAFLNKKKGTKKKEELKPEDIKDKKTTHKTENSASSTNKSLSQTNFLVQKNDPNFQKGKVFKEDEIGKTLSSRGYKDLLDEKNGNFDVNKMNEDQYNQLRLLNNLHNVANNLDQESDSEMSVNTSIASYPSSTKGEDDFIIDDKSFQNLPKEKETGGVSKAKMDQCKDENNEVENIKKEIEKEIGNDLFKEIITLLDNSIDKNDIKFDREAICKKVNDLSSKGFDKAKLEKAVEKINEIFAVYMKDKILV